MRYSKLTRTAVLGTSVALCFAVAGPAAAHENSASGTGSRTSSAPTLAQQQAWMDSFIAKRQQAITAYAAEVAADPKLTSAQRSAIAGKLAQQRAALNTLKAAVDSAMTSDALHHAIKAAMAADGVHGYFGWCGFYGSHRSAQAGIHRTDKAKPQPTAVKPAVHTVAVRAQPARHPDHHSYQGRHRGGDSHGGSFAGHSNGWSHHR